MRCIPVIIYFIQNVPGAVCETHSKVTPERQLSSALPEDPGPNIYFRGNQGEPHGECEREINRPRVSLFLAEPVLWASIPPRRSRNTALTLQEV